MATIVGLSRSLRKGAFNAALLRAARELVADGVALDIATIHGIPLYPAGASAVVDRIAQPQQDDR